jgi:hypothetical protein
VTPGTDRISPMAQYSAQRRLHLDGKGVNQVATKKVSPKKPASGDSTKGKKSAATRVSRVQRVQRVKRVKRVKR